MCGGVGGVGVVSQGRHASIFLLSAIKGQTKPEYSSLTVDKGEKIYRNLGLPMWDITHRKFETVMI